MRHHGAARVHNPENAIDASSMLLDHTGVKSVTYSLRRVHKRPLVEIQENERVLLWQLSFSQDSKHQLGPPGSGLNY